MKKLLAVFAVIILLLLGFNLGLLYSRPNIPPANVYVTIKQDKDGGVTNQELSTESVSKPNSTADNPAGTKTMQSQSSTPQNGSQAPAQSQSQQQTVPPQPSIFEQLVGPIFPVL